MRHACGNWIGIHRGVSGGSGLSIGNLMLYRSTSGNIIGLSRLEGFYQRTANKGVGA